MGSDVVISVEGLGKRYRRGTPSGQDRLSEVLYGLGRLAWSGARRLFGGAAAGGGGDGAGPDGPDEFWALKDVSFEVRRGEVVGVIGRNGAGKSTLLKVLSRVTEPTAGRFGVRGRVGSLLEVGTGFHPELTGRENIYLNGTILGMPRQEVRRRFDDIVAFSGLDGAFLDTPVKRYSSGMYVRLGFAVAAHMDTEVLIVDEVLAVGDQEFQKKCLGRIEDVARQGRTVLYVSHNLASVRRLCGKATLLESGRMTVCGPPDEAIRKYLPEHNTQREVHYPDDPAAPMQLVRAALIAPVQSQVLMPQSLIFEITVKTREVVPGAYVCFGVRDSSYNIVYWTADIDTPRFEAPQQGVATLRCQCPAYLLTPGQYSVNFAIVAPSKGTVYQAQEQTVRFEIHDQESYLAAFGVRMPGVTAVLSQWELL